MFKKTQDFAYMLLEKD